MTDPERPRIAPLDDGPGPALPMSKPEIEAMVRAAMAEGTAAPAPTPAPPTARPGLWLWVAAGLMISVAAAAAIGTYVGVRVGLAEHDHEAAPPTPPPTPPIETPPAEPPRATTATAPTPVAEAPTPVEAPAAAPAPERHAHVATASAEDLLVIANRERAQHEWAAAAQTYERIVQQDDAADATYVAVVALASLELEHLSRPRAARRHYETALRLRPSGTLSEEARYGVAATYRAEGRDEDERRALTEYLAAHPSGLLATQARARLDALEPTP